MDTKKIDIFEMTERQCIYRYLLAAMYMDSNFKENNDYLLEFSHLMRTVISIEENRNGQGEKFYDSLQNLDETVTIMKFKKRMEKFINDYFCNFKTIEIINLKDDSLLFNIKRDLDYINVNYVCG